MSLERFCRVLLTRVSQLQQVQQQILERRRLADVATHFIEEAVARQIAATKQWVAQHPDSAYALLAKTSFSTVLLMPDGGQGSLVQIQATDVNRPHFHAFYHKLSNTPAQSNEPVMVLSDMEGLIKLGQFIEFTRKVDWSALERLRAYKEKQLRARIIELQKELNRVQAQVGPAALVTHLAVNNLHLVPEKAADAWFSNEGLQLGFTKGFIVGLRGYGSPAPAPVKSSDEVLFMRQLRDVIHQQAPEFWALVARHAPNYGAANEIGTLLGRYLRTGYRPGSVPAPDATATAFQALRHRTMELAAWVRKNHPGLVNNARQLWV